MALLFSAVTVTAGNEEIEFTVSGIPREYDDLVGWTAFDDSMKNVDAETEVSVHAEAYLYGGEETVYEISDLAYHVLVLMVSAGITVEDVTRELEKRHVIDHKVKQERMQ